MQKKLDDFGCTPKCASHKSFGFQTMELTECSKCEHVDDVNDVESNFMDTYYATEILSIASKIAE